MRTPHTVPFSNAVAPRAAPQAPVLEPLSAVLGGVGNQVAIAALTEGEALDGLGLLTHDSATLLIAGITPQASPGEGSNAVAQAVMRLARAEGVDHGRLAGLRLGGGQPLPPAVLARVSAVFGHDFHHVRVHQDATAARMSEAAQARAFTVGSEIWFNTGELDLSTATGVDLLLHELTHVLQADEGRLPRPRGPGLSVSSPSDPHEQEAMRTAAALAPELELQMAVTGDALIGEGLLEEESWGAAVGALPGATQAPSPSVASRQDKKHPIDEDLECGEEEGESALSNDSRQSGRDNNSGCSDDDEDSLFSVVEDTSYLDGDLLQSDDDLMYDDDTQSPFSAEESETELGENTLSTAVDEDGWSGVGMVVPAAILTGGHGKVTPNVAFRILENLARGEPAFKPSLGRGGCSWFVTEGAPYVGDLEGAGKTVGLPVEINRGTSPLVFSSANLSAIRDAKLPEAMETAEMQLRKKLPPETKLTSQHWKVIRWNAKNLAQKLMWAEIGTQIQAHPSRVGEVILERGEFSRTGPGKLLAVADANKIQVKGGVPAVVGALETAGFVAKPPLVAAADALAKEQRWTGRVHKVFHHGGRVLLVVAIGLDTYKVYTAQNRVKATVEVAGGWAGSLGAARYFTSVFSPLKAAGLPGKVTYYVGLLVSGAIGYWIGSETTSTVYELVLE